jgi:hypothetical protein
MRSVNDRGSAAGALAVLALVAGLGGAADDFEPAPALKAADFATPALLKGPKHIVDELAQGDGFLVAFKVTSSFGTWDAVDREMLDVRVREVYVLAALSEVSETKVFATAFAKAAEKKAQSVEHVVKDPVGTVKAIPGGLARFTRGLKAQAKEAEDKAKAGKQDAPADASGATDKAMQAVEAGGDALVDEQRRAWAQKVGADPYTTNKALSDKLHDVAWAAYAGGFALSVALPSMPGLGAVQAVDSLVYELPPGELLKRNDEKLRAAGVSDSAREALFLNRNFTPTLQTELAEAVAGLGAVPGLSAVVSLAAESRTEGDARYIRRCVRLLALGAKEVGAWSAFSTSRNEIEAVGADGRLVLPWSVDYMTWNAQTVPIETAPVEAAKVREVWISGVATDRAKRELAARRFEVRERRPIS